MSKIFKVVLAFKLLEGELNLCQGTSMLLIPIDNSVYTFDYLMQLVVFDLLLPLNEFCKNLGFALGCITCVLGLPKQTTREDICLWDMPNVYLVEI